MVLQGRRKALPAGRFGGVLCLHFDPRGGERCKRPSGEGVFCCQHTSDWGKLTEVVQIKFNELLLNPAFAYDAAQWDSLYEQYRASKAAADQASATAAAADYYASEAERAAASRAAQADSIERARQRVQGALRRCSQGLRSTADSRFSFGPSPDSASLAVPDGAAAARRQG